MDNLPKESCLVMERETPLHGTLYAIASADIIQSKSDFRGSSSVFHIRENQDLHLGFVHMNSSRSNWCVIKNMSLFDYYRSLWRSFLKAKFIWDPRKPKHASSEFMYGFSTARFSAPLQFYFVRVHWPGGVFVVSLSSQAIPGHIYFEVWRVEFLYDIWTIWKDIHLVFIPGMTYSHFFRLVNCTRLSYIWRWIYQHRSLYMSKSKLSVKFDLSIY